MSNQQNELSKRQLRREQIRRKEQRGRWIGIGLITLGALFVAFLIIWPNVRPVAEVIPAEPQTYPQADKTSMGNPNALIRIDAYEDFQCPACQKYTKETESQIITNLIATGKVYYVFHNYPFIDGAGAGNGGESDQAANASMCASEQGKFWEMHGTIFANWNGEGQGAYADNRLTAFADKAGLDMTAFNTCFKANKYKAEIQADFDGGNKLGVQGTPSIFVNGTFITPGFIPSYDDVLKAVEAASTK
ncbi:MAG: thioredoxin domain-containing protein [Chloroflexi bacterium]|nr:thioredoxin domain-containing protein [Chloroflexota bacterium]